MKPAKKILLYPGKINISRYLRPRLLYNGVDWVSFDLPKTIIGDTLVHRLNIVEGQAVIMVIGLLDQILHLQPNILSWSHCRNVRMLKQIPYDTNDMKAWLQITP